MSDSGCSHRAWVGCSFYFVLVFQSILLHVDFSARNCRSWYVYVLIGWILSCLEVFASLSLHVQFLPYWLLGNLHYLNSYFVLVLKIDFGRWEVIYSMSFTQLHSCQFMSLDSIWPVPINAYGTTCYVALGFEAWFYSACTIHYGKFLVRVIFFNSSLEIKNHVS